ncbi:FKBP-type peptidyl-prolyl cis-trans isomerase [Deinococcus sp.]|uniref:FKBP-type peptidyl-prolyl cis-trans isomerase n=1 Tax=Deinococcus sp. TaxID=47478 RepID=UPI0025C3A69B|nr:FKBP-type peptidyl-prolyl cis-trans isomerase [Deinococcus sp.]
MSSDQLIVEKYYEGSGAPAQAGKMVSVHYTGTLENGQKFDSSHDRGAPIQFPLGVGYVIPGWDQGIAQMRVGDKAKLTIPGALGYGEQGIPGVIPPNATLIFDVELVEVR